MSVITKLKAACYSIAASVAEPSAASHLSLLTCPTFAPRSSGLREICGSAKLMDCLPVLQSALPDSTSCANKSNRESPG